MEQRVQLTRTARIIQDPYAMLDCVVDQEILFQVCFASCTPYSSRLIVFSYKNYSSIRRNCSENMRVTATVYEVGCWLIVWVDRTYWLMVRSTPGWQNIPALPVSVNPLLICLRGWGVDLPIRCATQLIAQGDMHSIAPTTLNQSNTWRT